MTPTTARARDAEARRARAERILDAAGELLLRWGYKRLTMDDVAEQAGIGKGTIYLHWTTREDLFLAVIAREFGSAIEGLLEKMRAEPEAALLHNLMPSYFAALMGRPLLRAAIAVDPQTFGKFKGCIGEILDTKIRTAIEDYLRLHAEHGLLSDGFAVDELCYGVRVIIRGFFLADSLGMAEFGIPLERRAELLRTTLRLAFENDRPLTAEALQSISTRAIAIYSEIADYFRAQLHRSHE